jgi:hypothetical protein
MHYVSHTSHRMHRHKFGVMCPSTIFVESVPVPIEHENSVSMFLAPDAQECTTSPTDPTGCKIVQHNMS